MKRLKHSLTAVTKISLICLAFFVLFPSIHAHAMFSDTANINMGIKLELGTVSLAPMDNTTSGSINYSGGESTKIGLSKLVNDGSLSAKLAYKVDIIKKVDKTLLRAEELNGVSVILNFDTKAKEITADAAALNTGNFSFVKDVNNKDVIINPDEAEIPVTVQYKSNAPKKSEEIMIKVTFRLIQSNAADANADMFSDEETIEKSVSLVPKVIEESDWPINGFKELNGKKIKYNSEKMNMVFSETYDTNGNITKEIRNLNKAILYIKFPEKDQVTMDIKKNNKNTTIDSFSITEEIDGSAITIETIEVDKQNNGIKITFKLKDTNNNNSPNYESLSVLNSKNIYDLKSKFTINKYNINDERYSTKYDTFNFEKDLFATRLVLDTDIPYLITSYTQIPIEFMNEETLINFKKIKRNRIFTLWRADFEDVNFINERAEFEVTGGNNNYILKDIIPQKGFNLKRSNIKFNNAILNIKITGDTGYTLVISRKLVNGIKSKSMSMRSVEVPEVEEKAEIQPEQQPDPEIEVEEPEATVESTVPDESIIEVPLEEEVAEEESSDESTVIEETEEAVDSSSSESNAETPIPIEDSEQPVIKEDISDEQIKK